MNRSARTRRPLLGRRVVVTRSAEQAGALQETLERLGAETVLFPTIVIRPPRNPRPLDRALLRLPFFDWLVFTSANGVHRFFERLGRRGDDLRAVGHLKLAVIGPGTAEALAAWRLRADVVPEKYVAESLAEALAGVGVAGSRVLLPRAREARAALPRLLERHGAEVTVVEAYRTEPLRPRAAAVRKLLFSPPPDVLAFASAFTARSFADAVGAARLRRLRGASRVASIGPITSAALRAIGLAPDAQAREFTIPGLADAVVRAARRR